MSSFRGPNRRSTNVETLLDAIEDAVLLMERDGRVVLANAAATNRFGVGAADKERSEAGRTGLEALTLLELDLVPAEASLWSQWLRRVVDLRRPGYFEHETADSVHDIAMFPVKQTATAPARVAVVVRDVTQARQDQAALAAARREQADMANRLESLEKKLKDRTGRGDLLGSSPVMEAAFVRVDQAATMDVPVLITGEPGTGRALAAQVVHQAGDRSEGPLERVDCSGADEAHLESEIFGHVRGAFGTGRARKGRLEAAARGTLLLENLDALPLRLQQKLRWFLEHGEFEPMGGDRAVSVDVRLIASTSKKLVELVARGVFREDLSYLLRVMTIPLPALRDRAEDIALLAEHFLARSGEAMHKEPPSISPEALQALLTHQWPGNVRELRHAMEHAAIRCAGSEVLPIHLPSEVVTGPRTTDTGRRAGKEAVLRALETCRWNKTRAARLLGISRGTLYARMRDFDVQQPR